MLEARLKQAIILKKVLDSIKDLVKEANFDFNEDGLTVQSMDGSHVALASIEMRSECFAKYRCDRPMSIGISIESMTKIVRQAGNEDVVTLSKSDDNDHLEIKFEATKQDRVGEYEMKTMDIDAEHLGIPDTTYSSVVKFGSSEYARIVRDLLIMGESVKISVVKDGISFESKGDIGSAKLQLKQGSGGAAAAVKAEGSSAVKKEKGAKKEESDDEDEEEDEEEDDEDEEDEKPKSKKRKTTSKASTDGKKKKAAKKDGEESGPIPVNIEMQQATAMSFALKYLNHFAKAGPLADTVALSMTDDLPLMVGYEFEGGHVRFFLAPKIDEDNDDE